MLQINFPKISLEGREMHPSQILVNLPAPHQLILICTTCIKIYLQRFFGHGKHEIEVVGSGCGGTGFRMGLARVQQDDARIADRYMRESGPTTSHHR